MLVKDSKKIDLWLLAFCRNHQDQQESSRSGELAVCSLRWHSEMGEEGFLGYDVSIMPAHSCSDQPRPSS